jgi:hypothetical protein
VTANRWAASSTVKKVSCTPENLTRFARLVNIEQREKTPYHIEQFTSTLHNPVYDRLAKKTFFDFFSLG